MTETEQNLTTAEKIAKTAEKALADIAARAAEFREKLPKPEPKAEPDKMQEIGVETVEYAEPAFIRAAQEAIFAQQFADKRAEMPKTVSNAANARIAAAPQRKPLQKRREELPRRESRMQQLQRLSDEVAGELPREFYEKLSGGIALTDAMKFHPQSVPQKPLLILGEYRNDRNLGRSIMLYGGSILRTYGHLPEPALKDELRRIIRHEFTHHIESLCGERGLEIWDEYRLAEYKEGLDK